MERFKILAVLVVSVASSVSGWEEGSCEQAAYDILTNVFNCTVISDRGGSGLSPWDFCAFPDKYKIDRIKTYCPNITESLNSNDDAGWYRSMCESQVWAEDERFRNCTWDIR